MTDLDAFAFTILERVAARGPMDLEDLQQLFRHQSWNRLFVAVDQLSRKGSLTIQRIDRCSYLISLGPQFAVPAAERITLPFLSVSNRNRRLTAPPKILKQTLPTPSAKMTAFNVTTSWSTCKNFPRAKTNWHMRITAQR
jgi:hypothetical protein